MTFSAHEPQPKEFYCKYKDLNSNLVWMMAGRVIDYQVMTDTLQGIKFCTDGTHFQLNYKTSYELCGQDCDTGEPAKIIRAKNGEYNY